MACINRDCLADADLAEIARYIGHTNHSPAAARRFLDRLNAKLQLYAAQSEMGELRPDLGEDIRIIPFGN